MRSATKISNVVRHATTSLLVFLWIYAAISKGLDSDNFLYELQRQPVGFAAPLLRWMIPLVELVISVLLLRRNTNVLGLQLSLGLLAVFSGYILWILLFAEQVPCSCGGVISLLSWPAHLVFNSFFMGAAAAGIYAERLIIRGEKTEEKSFTILRNQE